jgi:hypothetical protein
MNRTECVRHNGTFDRILHMGYHWMAYKPPDALGDLRAREMKGPTQHEVLLMELQNQQPFDGDPTTTARGPVPERHYTVAELARRWFFSQNTIRRLFSCEPGVVRIARPQTRSKRGYTSIRIPERIAERVHRRLQGLT